MGSILFFETGFFIILGSLLAFLLAACYIFNEQYSAETASDGSVHRLERGWCME